MIISEATYVLQQESEAGWNDRAVLNGGASALLPAMRPLDEASLEMAIEVAENWLMPHARHLRGDVLEVSDTTGRLTSGLMDVMSESATSWSVADLEQLFLRMVDLATGRIASPALEGRRAFAADLLILRELAHHGDVGEIRLF
ncbi:hypothetical protein JI739_19300 [Ramlibacter sp. AW1]|uniref:Uncharacterized protein n=1 Tax=Ramlibacter aurantiacus TaxID=2801330 RepID=A0A936ZTX9_9BURK|nr:hypothetical protein [Ramlibacter aurantiacus]MBL0422501.1 hypothetical protein [Ramlibacter aurantiacus]